MEGTEERELIIRVKKLTQSEITKYTCPKLSRLSNIQVVRPIEQQLSNYQNLNTFDAATKAASILLLNKELEKNTPMKRRGPGRPKKTIVDIGTQTLKRDTKVDVGIQTTKLIEAKDLQKYIHYCCDQCVYKSREGTEFKEHLDENHNISSTTVNVKEIEDMKCSPSPIFDDDHLDDESRGATPIIPNNASPHLHADPLYVPTTYEKIASDEDIAIPDYDSDHCVPIRPVNNDNISLLQCWKCELPYDGIDELIEHIDFNHANEDSLDIFCCQVENFL